MKSCTGALDRGSRSHGPRGHLGAALVEAVEVVEVVELGAGQGLGGSVLEGPPGEAKSSPAGDGVDRARQRISAAPASGGPEVAEMKSCTGALDRGSRSHGPRGHLGAALVEAVEVVEVVELGAGQGLGGSVLEGPPGEAKSSPAGDGVDRARHFIFPTAKAGQRRPPVRKSPSFPRIARAAHLSGGGP
jgi:hypothetical protein